MPITLTNISQTFIEQLNRRKTYTFGSLDQMQCIYVGLTSQVDSFVPNPGSPHAVYPLMLVKDVSVSDSHPGLSEVQVSYTGKLLSQNQSSFVSTPTVTESVQEKEFQYIRNQALAVGRPTYVNSKAFQTYKVGTANYSKRYLTNNIAFKYQANPRPASPVFQSRATGLAYITECGDSWNGTINGVLSFSPVVQDLTYIIPSWGQVFVLVNFRRDAFYTWYECEETYELRYQNL